MFCLKQVKMKHCPQSLSNLLCPCHEAYIQVCRGLMITSVCLGFFGAILALVGMKCTKIGGSETTKARLTVLSGFHFILSGKTPAFHLSTSMTGFMENVTSELLSRKPFNFRKIWCSNELHYRLLLLWFLSEFEVEIFSFPSAGLCSMTACSIYAHRITTDFFDPLFVAQKLVFRI